MYNIVELFQYSFVVRALLVGTLMSICAALLGVSLVLKRYSMIGDGLSHVGFGALAVAMALNLVPLYVAIPLTLLAAYVLLKLGECGRLKGDAAIAILSSSALAIGIIVVSCTQGFNADVGGYLFGSILAVSKSDVYLGVGIALLVLVLYVVFYNKIFAITFDESFARAIGVNTDRYRTLLAALTALVVVVGMRIMGAMLMSSLLVFPAITAMRIFSTFRCTIICAATVSVVCLLAGLLGSLLFSIPTGASIVMANLIAYALARVVGR
ncbi:metal ABC transporter permease [Deferribacterales bacterium RsTz2092]|nr:ABC transporter [Deferribacterales bacterium]